MAITCVLFDFDGTLVDTRADIVAAVNVMLRTLGLPRKSFQQIVSYIGGGIRELMARAAETDDERVIDRALTAFEAYFREHSSDRARLYPHVREVLSDLAHIAKIIVTNRKREFTELSLAALGIGSSFQGIVAGDDVLCLKPSPCPVEKALGLGTVERRSCLMVGDMDVDVLAGKSAGVMTCAVTYGFGKRAAIERACPDYLIDDLSELTAIVARGGTEE